MTPFLQEVAHDLYIKLNGDFSKTAIIFPNKRAGLFFNEYLAKESEKPMWSPSYLTIQDLFKEISPLNIGDPILLVCILYNIYKEQTNSEETLDSFYPWGQMLISDFDDIDKNLVNADCLFKNLQELKDGINDLSFLDEEQVAAIKQFFTNFSIEKDTELKRKFISLWNKLHDIYHSFKEQLEKMNIAYEGMLYRTAIELINPQEMPYERYVFVGFNVLNKVEGRLFNLLHDADKAMFYWDYDIFYAKDNFHEAGEFIDDNIHKFGNELDEEHFNHLCQQKKIRIISSVSENAQARFIPQWLSDSDEDEERNNAIVLCNESMLLPVLHSIPDDVAQVNITMGFPLNETPVYSFIKAIVDLQTGGYNADKGLYDYSYIRSVLNHPYTQLKSDKASDLLKELTNENHISAYPSELQLDEFLTLVFTPQDNNSRICNYLIELLKEIATIYNDKSNDNSYNQLYIESIYKSYVTVNRLLSLIESGYLKVEAKTFNGLLTGILHALSIPFHGEPAVGVQVMGVLETRNLDFNNLLILSLNEGQLPKSGSDMSFIPYNLRKAFGMTTIEHKNAVFAYYFYRLIQRADEITLLYNSFTEGLNKGEMSRFMLQLLVEWPFEIKRELLEANQQPTSSSEISIIKGERVMNQLYKRFDWNKGATSILSPSALNKYINCPLCFYFQYVASIKEPEDVTIEIDSPTFGIIFHHAAKLIYQYLSSNGNIITKECIDKLLHDPRHITMFLDTAFKEDFFKIKEEEKAQYNGTQLINFKVIETYLKQLLELDKRYAPFNIVNLEDKIYEEYPMQTPDGTTIMLHLGGYVDRTDTKDGIFRIVDYKTGSDPITPSEVADLFNREGKHADYIFQAFLYSVIIHRQQPAKQVKPALLYIHKAADANYSSDILIGQPRQTKEAVDDIAQYETTFRGYLGELINEIFNAEVPFTQTKDTGNCQYCAFAKICRKE
jgi:hypothetical protein